VLVEELQRAVRSNRSGLLGLVGVAPPGKLLGHQAVANRAAGGTGKATPEQASERSRGLQPLAAGECCVLDWVT